MAEIDGAVLITGCSTGIGRATAELLARDGQHRLRHRAPPGVDRGPARERLQDARARRERRGLDERRRGRGGGGRGRGGRAREQRRLQPERRGGERSARQRARPVRDERLRPAPDVPARAARHAPRGPRPDRERQLDGRQARLPGRRHLPRHQARRRGDLGRHALRGQGLRRPGGGDRAGPDQDELRRDRGRRRCPTRTVPTRTSTSRSPRPPWAPTTGPLARLGGGPEAVAKAIRRRSRRGGRRPATR